MAFSQYVQDYDELFPAYNGGNSATMGWGTTIQPYLKTSQLWKCPSTLYQQDNKPNGWGLGQGSTYNDYAMNIYLSSAHMALVEFPTSVDLISFRGDGQCDLNCFNEGRSLGDPALQRHFGGDNYGFVDGHVKWLRPEKVLSGGGANCCDLCTSPNQPDKSHWATANNYTFCRAAGA